MEPIPRTRSERAAPAPRPGRRHGGFALRRPVVTLGLAALFAWCLPAQAAERTAAVAGEVARPGTYAVARGERLSALIGKAGGFTDDAAPRGAVLTRKAQKARQAAALAGIVRRIEEGTQGAAPEDRPARDAFLASLRRLEPAGRIAVRLVHPRLLKGTPGDLLVEDGDVLLVPREEERVFATGAVRSPGPLPRREGAAARDYITQAGGPSEDGDPRRAWLLAADGTTRRLARGLVEWNPDLSRWEVAAVWGAPPPPVGPGDTIVVPRAAGRLPWLSGVKDVDALLRRVAEITGTVVLP